MRKIIGILLLSLLLCWIGYAFITFLIQNEQICLGKFKGSYWIQHGVLDERVRCFSCDEKETVWTTPKECTSCSSREIVREVPGDSNRVLCALKCPANSYRISQTKCDFCKSYKVSFATKEDCEKCPDRIYKDEKCILKVCPENTFRNDTMNCIDCGDAHSVSSKKEECLKCSNREMITIEAENEFPVLPGSFPEKIERCVSKCKGKCRDYWGNCYNCGDCQYLGAYSVSEGECSKCSNRQLIDGLCVLKACPKGKKLELPYGCIQTFMGII